MQKYKEKTRWKNGETGRREYREMERQEGVRQTVWIRRENGEIQKQRNGKTVGLERERERDRERDRYIERRTNG